uniref:Uncharacterized protein n=1 Tax=Dicentrarchus labrax TaxID=13489 RepID=A0A8C4H5R5_DICLA
VVEIGSCILKGLHSPREEEKGEDPWIKENHLSFAKKETFKSYIKNFCSKSHNCKHHVHSPDHVPHEEEEGISGRGAKVFAINRISVYELDKFLQTPEAALQTAQQELGTLILGSYVLAPPPHTHTPERSPKGRKHWEGRHVIRFDEGPVVRGKSPGQGHLSQSRDEVGTPEEEEDVVELQGDQVFVVNGLSTVEGKKALGVRALLSHQTGCVVLSTDTGYIDIDRHRHRHRQTDTQLTAGSQVALECSHSVSLKTL